ncbi:MAG: glycosyltransferase family 2 protein [Crocosphaera sp.]
MTRNKAKIAVVIPCFRVSQQILSVIDSIGNEVTQIYVVDDCCPQKSGHLVKEYINDNRVKVIFLQKNKGVGGATIAGIYQAIADGATVIVKVDGDGQMDVDIIPIFVNPILHREADYTKGNRFFNLDGLQSMPLLRLMGNIGLSFLSKLSSGYWNINDPTNGFFAINANVASVIPWEKIDKRYFFESDILFQLNIIQAKVFDIPMKAVYGDENSNLNPWKELPYFFIRHLQNLSKRIFYCYILRDFNIASIELLLSLPLLIFGTIYGINHWTFTSPTASAGTVMVAALPLIIGLQLFLAFLNYDIQSVPKISLQKRVDMLNSLIIYCNQKK